jgi:hypothetical protein
VRAARSAPISTSQWTSWRRHGRLHACTTGQGAGARQEPRLPAPDPSGTRTVVPLGDPLGGSGRDGTARAGHQKPNDARQREGGGTSRGRRHQPGARGASGDPSMPRPRRRGTSRLILSVPDAGSGCAEVPCLALYTRTVCRTVWAGSGGMWRDGGHLRERENPHSAAVGGIGRHGAGPGTHSFGPGGLSGSASRTNKLSSTPFYPRPDGMHRYHWGVGTFSPTFNGVSEMGLARFVTFPGRSKELLDISPRFGILSGSSASGCRRDQEGQQGEFDPFPGAARPFSAWGGPKGVPT